ncbi:hypothetical protein ESZ50_06200 [Weissella muntiaci]|uniref:ImmA/IrrE family metallo-endopeptidase n=1 Tax=Weissella muntiaci TaxID=2508881 RepID=A0A6C2C5B5_9LACO|nr:hypothetical protein [Weissella muntiaci]TYC48849.1 hypothetical protein ESZ50_06200 [Weissella muntiaci]
MHYLDIVKSIGIPLIWSDEPIASKGFYLPNAKMISPVGALFVQSDLSESEIENVVLHELGHKIDGDILTRLSAPQLHIINESKANRFMIHKKASEWINGFEGNYPNSLDVVVFLKWAHLPLRLYAIAEDEIKDLVTPSVGSFL